MSPQKRGNWLEAFLEGSLKRKPKQDLVNILPKAKLLFWRGKRVEPMYTPPLNFGCREGNTEVDLTILTEKAIVFVEAKYHSEIDTRTTHCPNRDQIIRNIDVGAYYAWNKGLDFYFVLLTSSNCTKSRKLLKHYLENPQEIVDLLDRELIGKLGEGYSGTLRTIIMSWLSEKGYLTKGGKSGKE